MSRVEFSKIGKGNFTFIREMRVLIMYLGLNIEIELKVTSKQQYIILIGLLETL